MRRPVWATSRSSQPAQRPTTASPATNLRSGTHRAPGGATTAPPQSTGTRSGSRASTSRTHAVTTIGSARSRLAAAATTCSARAAELRTVPARALPSATGRPESARSLPKPRDLVAEREGDHRKVVSFFSCRQPFQSADRVTRRGLTSGSSQANDASLASGTSELQAVGLVDGLTPTHTRPGDLHARSHFAGGEFRMHRQRFAALIAVCTLVMALLPGAGLSAFAAPGATPDPTRFQATPLSPDSTFVGTKSPTAQ